MTSAADEDKCLLLLLLLLLHINPQITATLHHHIETHYFKDLNIQLVDYFIFVLYFITDQMEDLMP